MSKFTGSNSRVNWPWISFASSIIELRLESESFEQHVKFTNREKGVARCGRAGKAKIKKKKNLSFFISIQAVIRI